jgi:hypothetical protein
MMIRFARRQEQLVSGLCVGGAKLSIACTLRDVCSHKDIPTRLQHTGILLLART